jgi:hypothetical protein
MEKTGKSSVAGKEAVTRSTHSSAFAIIEREKVVNEYVEAYLSDREKKQRKTNLLFGIMFAVYILMAIAIFGILYDIRQANLEFIEMKKRITREMLQDYKNQVQKQDEAINGYREKK